MTVSFKIPHLIFCTLIGLIVFTISCTDTEVKELVKLKKEHIEIKAVAYINSVIKKGGKYFIVVDLVEYSKSDNSATHGKTNRIDLPNGYSIINQKIEFTEKVISDTVIITMQTLNYDDYGNFKFKEKIDIDKLKKLYLNPEYERYKHIPFQITAIDNQINSITEIYIP